MADMYKQMQNETATLGTYKWIKVSNLLYGNGIENTFLHEKVSGTIYFFKFIVKDN